MAYTSPEVARAHVEYLGRRYCLGSAPLVMWEHFAGGGAYMDAWRHCRPWDTVVGGDRPESVDWIVGNITGQSAVPRLRDMLRHAGVGVSLLIDGGSLPALVPGPLWEVAPPDELCGLNPAVGGARVEIATWFRRAGEWRGRMRLARYNWRTGQMWGRG
ncbi:MAG: hypothetical protein ACPGRF_06365 [Miltoncostaeaceae bacterium]